MTENLKPSQPERKDVLQKPDTDKLIEIGLASTHLRNYQRNRMIYLGLILDPASPSRKIDSKGLIGFTRHSLEKEYPTSLPAMGDLFEKAARVGVRLMEEEKTATDPYISSLTSGMLEVYGALFGNKPEDDRSSYVQAGHEARDRFRRQGAFSPDVISGVLSENPKGIAGENQPFYHPGRKSLEGLRNKMLFMMDQQTNTHSLNLTRENAGIALQLLSRVDQDIARQAMIGFLHENSVELSYPWHKYDDPLFAVDLTEERIKRLQFGTKQKDGALEVQLDGETLFLHMYPPESAANKYINRDVSLGNKGRIPETYSYAVAVVLDSMGAIVNRRDWDKDTLQFLAKLGTLEYAFTTISNLKHLLKDMRDGRATNKTVEQLLTLYSQLTQKKEEYFYETVKKDIQADGTLYPVPVDMLYFFDNEPELPYVEGEWAIEEAIYGERHRDSDHEKAMAIRSYLIKKGYSLPKDEDRGTYPGRNDRLYSSSDIYAARNSSRNEYEARKSKKAFTVRNPAEVGFRDLVWGEFKDSEGKEFNNDPSGGGYGGTSSEFYSMIPMVPSEGTAYIPIPEGSILRDLRLYPIENTGGRDEAYQVLVDEKTGYVKVKVPKGWRSFEFEGQVVGGAHEKIGLPDSLSGLDSDVVLGIADELFQGLPLLSSALREKVLKDKETNRKLSLFDLESVVRSVSDYSFDSRFNAFTYEDAPLQSLLKMKSLLGESGRFQIQCDGAYLILSSLVKLYIEKAEIQDVDVVPQFSYPFINSYKNNQAIYSAASHVRVGIVAGGSLVGLLDATPGDFAPVGSKRFRSQDMVENVVSTSFPTESREKRATEKDLSDVLLGTQAYAKWIRGLSDMQRKYFSDLPFIAIPRKFQEVGGARVSGKERQALKKFVADQKALIDEYVAEFGGTSTIREKLPVIENVSNNPEVLGILSQMINVLSEKTRTPKKASS